MTSTTATDPELFRIDIAEDRLSATMQLRARDKDLSPTKEQIVEALEKHKIVIDEAVERKIEVFLTPADGAEPTRAPFIVAEGTPPVEGRDEEFLWDPVYDKTARDWQGDAPVNYYTFNSIITVAEGATIGSIKPLVESVDGLDIFGRPIPAKTKPRRLQWDNTIRQDREKPSQLVAAVAGRVVEKECGLSIKEVLTVDGDVDFDSCNIDATSEVEITGTVRDRFEVKCARSVTVGGAVEAAEVLAGNNIVVRGGILGRGKGRVDAGGDITARFGYEADLQAKGNIRVCSQLMNCRTHAGGSLQADLGAIIGGYHYARGGISARTVGSEGYKPTRVAIGIHPRVLKQAEEIERSLEPKRRRIGRIRSTVQPLMADLKRLTSAQKEQATALLSEADKTETEITEALARRDRILQAGRANETPRLLVAQTIYPAVTISVGYRLHTFAGELTGPYSIEVRPVDEVTQMVALNRHTGSVQILPSRKLTFDELLEGFEMGQAANAESTTEGDGETADSPD
jgi:uncharacterized protein (DUF342 family)